jgi:hypothetical protein
VLLEIPASYGIAMFANEKLPIEVAAMAGIAFGATYIGAVAFADQQFEIENTWKIRNIDINPTTILWWLLNLIAVLCSATMNVLFFAGGKYAYITPEAFTHGAPLAVLGFMYALLLHTNASRAIHQVHKLEQKELKRLEDEETRKQNTCICGRGFISKNALYGHQSKCNAYRASK